MAWTAPEVERPEPVPFGDEHAALTSWLDFYRATLLWKCGGLTLEQLRLRPIASTPISLLGLVRHLTDVERAWYRNRISGEDAPFHYWLADGDTDFAGVDDADGAADFALFAAECDHSRAVMASRSFDQTLTFANRAGDTLTRDVRWVMVHMVEEYARHLGHADLIREEIDGSTGY